MKLPPWAQMLAEEAARQLIAAGGPGPLTAAADLIASVAPGDRTGAGPGDQAIEGAGIMDRFTRVFEATLIRAALRHTRGRRVEAAQRLGIGRNTITRKIQELGLDD